MINVVDQLTISQAVATDVRTADGASATGIDLQDYIGQVGLILSSDVGTGNANNTLDVTVTGCATLGGSYTAALADNKAFAEVSTAAAHEVIYLDTRSVERFIKLNWDVEGTSPSFAFGVTLVGQKRTA